MKNQNVGNYIKFVLAILLLLAGMIAINVGIQRHQTIVKETANQKVEKLSIAIVNEDIPIQTSGDKTYNLGASYIKSLEKNTEHDWTVTTRGTAEAGLTSDKYQLMVVIPSNFSEKVIAINSKYAEPATITYKVNAQGNTQVEVKANKVGDQIVNGLNQQLVDMYMVSVLENIYTAQQNVQTLNAVQEGNISSYQTSLYPSTIAFPSHFPALASLSNVSITGTDTLHTATEVTSKLFDTQLKAQQTTEKSLQDLIVLRSTEQITYGDFMTALMAMNQQVLSEDTQILYDSLKKTQYSLTTSINNIGLKDETTSVSNGAIGELTAQIESLKGMLESEKQKNEERAQSLALDLYQAIYKYYYPTESIPESVAGFTIRELLSGSARHRLSYTETDYRSAVTEQEATFKRSLSELPNESAYNSILPLLADPSKIEVDKVLEINQYAQIHYAEVLSTQTDVLYTRLLQEKDYLDSYINSYTGRGTVDISAPATDFSYSVVVPDSIVLSDITVRSGGSITDPTHPQTITVANVGDKVTLEYTYKYVHTQLPITNSPITVYVGSQNYLGPVDYTHYLSQDYKTRLKAYYDISSEIVQRYQTAYQLMLATSVLSGSDRVPMTIYSDTFFNQDVFELLLTIVKNSSLNSHGTTDTMLTNILEQIKELEEKRDSLQEKVMLVSRENAQLATDMNNIMVSLKSIKEQSNALLTQKGIADKSRASIDTSYNEVIAQVKGLVSGTTDLKGNSQQNLETINTVKQSFAEFNSKVQSVQEQSQTMSADAEELKIQMEKQLKQDNDFVASFVTVFSNAYQNGVPNEELIKFLSNPVVSGETGGIKTTTNIYKPFTWILILGIISLFVAYVFGTQTVLEKTRDIYKVDKLSETDWLTTALLVGLSIVLGVVVGIFSAKQLEVSQVMVPFWIVMIVLFSIVLVQGNYLLVKNMRVIGMGLALTVLISYIYLTSAVGTVVTGGGFLSFFKSINVLSTLESSLSGILMKEPDNGLRISLPILIAIGLILGNTFMPLVWKINKGVKRV